MRESLGLAVADALAAAHSPSGVRLLPSNWRLAIMALCVSSGALKRHIRPAKYRSWYALGDPHVAGSGWCEPPASVSCPLIRSLVLSVPGGQLCRTTRPRPYVTGRPAPWMCSTPWAARSGCTTARARPPTPSTTRTAASSHPRRPTRLGRTTHSSSRTEAVWRNPLCVRSVEVADGATGQVNRRCVQHLGRASGGLRRAVG